MKTRILAILAAFTFCTAIAIAADNANDNKTTDTSKAACCQQGSASGMPCCQGSVCATMGTSCPMMNGGTCAMLSSGTCPMMNGGTCAMLSGGSCPMMNGASCAAPASEAKAAKAKPAAQAACCASDGCGSKTGSGQCSCSKK